MKKILEFLLLFLLIGCSINKKEPVNNETYHSKDMKAIEDKVEKIMDDMTIEEKIGQMIFAFYNKDVVDDELKDIITNTKIGGFVLFAKNFSTYEKTLSFIKEVKKYNSIPLFISIDQEGGKIQRLNELRDVSVSDIPYMYDLGSMNDKELSYNVGKVIAEELRVFCINMDFAPVLDIYSNSLNTVIGKRAFGSDYKTVTDNALSLAKGLEDNGIIPVYKHFPGHGDTIIDSHEDLPIITKSREELLNFELIPFKRAIESGANIIMVGHLAVPSITKDNIPASLSKKLISDFLKDELGYRGLVITDALNMKALTNYYSEDELCPIAVKAGVDLLLMPPSPKVCLTSVINEIQKGNISIDRINESVRKILKLKYLKIDENYNNYLPKEFLNSNSHKKILNGVKQ
ncbi:MAG: glycoside hydrolase family 3 protein [Bacilli bacterium]|nr:glycoside hydrolase family 3 protein [Bacilli bacterium]